MQVSVPGETFGLETWGAGLILSHLILTGRIPLPDCTSSTTKTAPPTVLDLGCGVGIAGIASGKVIQRQRQHHRASPTTNTSNIHTTDPLVFLTDYVPCVIANVQHNILLNDTSDLCSVRKLDWTNLDAVWTEQVDPAFPQMFDLIIASDVLYGEVTAGLLPNVLARLLRRPLAESKSKSTYTPRIHLLTPCRSSTWSIFHAQFARAMNELGIVEVPLHQPDTFSPPLSTPAAATSAAKRDYALDPYTYQTDPCAHQILTPTSACLRGAPQETWKAAMVDGYRWGEWRWKVDVAKM
ncbi:hypothetical protein M427DRAFT_384643 [Gonapodya prolifera JEL478]|uniref:S-adenosyl-L-methionine-dependent methyltransferase n=1 Tax=Gonapodya prolifera (strain JEL478) TaxID=1344416 RepID=A0A139A8A5_GONPJ|nr:hypothetical protein M427DRAFT_384643 [Gonapodya prolifera JEL478]|eukprot:KXS13036.1 hypothetical protein M427DRAFT_384643 [Gonapodya prolifera JEL478]